jgi:WD40 repeat protein
MSDGSIFVWDTSLVKLVATLWGHTSVVTSLVSLNDGRLVSGSMDSALNVWNTTNGGAFVKRILTNDQNVAVNVLQLLSDLTLVVGLDDGQIQVWDMFKYTLNWNMYLSGSVLALKLLSNGYLAALEGGLNILDMSTQSSVISYTFGAPLVSLELLNDQILVTGDSNNVRYYDYINGAFLTTFNPFSQAKSSILSLSSSLLAIGGRSSGNLQLWQVNATIRPIRQTLKLNLNNVSLQSGSNLSSLAYNGQKLAVGYLSGAISLIESNGTYRLCPFLTKTPVTALLYEGLI